jgi:hypothetical protein
MSTATVEYKSLYDYVGKPVGKEIAREVYKVSKENGIKVESQEISNKNYNGKVLTYPVDFLETYFKALLETNTK